MVPGGRAEWGGAGLTSSRALVSTLKPWLVSILCRLSKLESMASKWSLSSVLAGVSGAGEAEPWTPACQGRAPLGHTPLGGGAWTPGHQGEWLRARCLVQSCWAL